MNTILLDSIQQRDNAKPILIVVNMKWAVVHLPVDDLVQSPTNSESSDNPVEYKPFAFILANNAEHII